LRYNLEDSYALKHVIETLFGNLAWIEIKHATDLATWKKYANKILSAILFSAKSTVKIKDDFWLKELEAEIKHGKEKIKLTKNTEQLFSVLAASLTRVSFLQLGHMPCHLTSKQVTLRHPSNWQLNQYRSVQYVQSEQQLYNKKAHNKSINGVR